MKNILFVCWDGPQVNYLEGLFLPIFMGLRNNYHFYIIQFSWAGADKITHLKDISEKAGVTYEHFSINRKPHPLIGSLLTLQRGTKFILGFTRRHNIDIIMPRSTFPAIMALSVLRKQENLKMVFDADGLPLEERVDFSGLNQKGLQYKLLKYFEAKAIVQADVIITRTNAALNYLISDNHALKEKFFTVSNGRDTSFFEGKGNREEVRKLLGIANDALLLVYAGSLGPQYCVDEMLHLYHEVSKVKEDTYLLILTGDVAYLSKPGIAKLIDKNVLVINAPFQKMPAYLAAANVALAIRKPTFSMKGVAPIKIGEYLLARLPVVASAGIGDTEEILKNERSCFVLQNHELNSLKAAAKWVMSVHNDNLIKEEARALGVREFSLEKSIKSYKKALSQIN